MFLKCVLERFGKYSFFLVIFVVFYYQGIYGYKLIVRVICQNVGGRGGWGVVCDRLFVFKGYEVFNIFVGCFMVQKVESYVVVVINSFDILIYWVGI